MRRGRWVGALVELVNAMMLFRTCLQVDAIMPRFTPSSVSNLFVGGVRSAVAA
jgi:hypothetical protein